MLNIYFVSFFTLHFTFLHNVSDTLTRGYMCPIQKHGEGVKLSSSSSSLAPFWIVH